MSLLALALVFPGAALVAYIGGRIHDRYAAARPPRRAPNYRYVALPGFPPPPVRAPGLEFPLTTDLDLKTLTLQKGGHSGPAQGMCLLEAAAYMAGEDWSDHPECVCTVLGSFGRNLNDVLPDAKRQLLVPLLPALLGTAGDGHAETRSYMALDWLIRTYLPTWLSLTERIPARVAQSIRELPPIVDMESARAAGLLVRDARDKAAAAWAAARAAARAAATQVLAPTVAELQDSAIDLYAAMVRVGK